MPTEYQVFCSSDHGCSWEQVGAYDCKDTAEAHADLLDSGLWFVSCVVPALVQYET